MPVVLESHRAVVIQVGGAEFLYMIGGREAGGSISNKVHFAQVNPDGTLGAWTPTLSIYHTAGVQEHSAVAVGDRIYVLGGRGNSWNTFSSVYCAKPDATGRISDWISVAPMPTGLALHAAVVVDSVIFVISGYSSQQRGFVREVWAADITGGACANIQWRPYTEQYLPRAAHSAVAVRLENGRKFIYVTGGYDGHAYRSVWRAEVDSSGKLTPWVPLPDISQAPAGLFRHASVISGHYLYVIGGTTNGSDRLDSVYRARINNDGSLGPWSSLDGFPVAVFNHAATVSASGSIYVLGGNTSSGISAWGYFAPVLAFEKSASPEGSVTYGDTINYTLTLTNLDVRDFENLIVTDTVSSNVPIAPAFQDLPAGCQVCADATNTITCTILSLGLGEIRDLSFGVTITRPTSALLAAPISVQVPATASTAHTTWTQRCAAARLEVLGVGISDPMSDTLHIPNPETIIGDSVRAQAAFKIGSDGRLDRVTFCSGDKCYSLTEPTSTYSSTAVYEQDVQKSGAITVYSNSVGDVQASALTAYFLRAAEENRSLVGHTMNQPVYHDTYTQVLRLPRPESSGDIIVRAAITDNNDPKRVISLTVQAGGVSQGITITTPNSGNYLDIREVQLSGVPTTTAEVTVIAQSPASNGESFSLVGLAAETGCPLCVLNRAQVCEDVGTDLWCWYASYFNTDRTYLPIVLRNAP